MIALWIFIGCVLSFGIGAHLGYGSAVRACKRIIHDQIVKAENSSKKLDDLIKNFREGIIKEKTCKDKTNKE